LRTLLIITFLLAGRILYSQDWLAGSKGNFVSEALDVVTDANGNSIVTGYFSGEIRFNDSIIQSVSGNSDIFVAKFNTLGAMTWIKRFGGPQADRGHKLGIDNTGAIYLTGYFAGTMNMGATALTSNGGSRDIFLAKLTPAGAVTWARSDGGSLRETPNGLATDSQGNVIITGQFEGNTTIGGVPFTSQTNPLTGTASFDIFIAKYTNAGVPVWTKKGNTKQDDNGLAVTCDNANNIYVTGQFPDTLNFIGQTINNQVNNAGYVAKLTPTGDVTWFRKLGAAQTVANAIQLNAAGEIYVTGNFLGTMIIVDNTGTFQLTNPFVKKIFLIKLGAATGNYIWGKAQGSDSEVNSRGLTIDGDQNIYIGGDFRCDFDEYRDLSDTGLWNTVGFRDIFVSKFSPAGQMIWNKHSGGKREDFCYALANGGIDKPVFAGSFENTLFIPTNTYNLTNVSASPNNVVFNGTPGSSVNFLFYSMEGDLSKNVYVGKVNDATNPPYYFYKPQGTGNTPSDYVDPELLPDTDTLEFCAATYLFFDPNVDLLVGPDYNFHWSAPNNDQNPFLYVAHMDESVTVSWESIDGCYNFYDTIYTIAHPLPPTPLMTDDHGFNTMAQSYSNINLCQPDTAVVHFDNLCTNCTLQINYYNTPFHTGASPFDVFTAGDYNVVVTNEFGCTSAGVFAVINDSIIDYDSISPQIMMIGDLDLDDTLTICEGEQVQFIVIDTITNPTDSLVIYGGPFIQEGFFSPDAQTNMNSGPHSMTIVPDSTRWYHINYNATIGYENTCATDTIKYHELDSFYIIVHPNPVINLSLISDSPLCEGDSGYISISQPIAGGIWTTSDGNSILWTSTDNDSILVNQAGYYSYAGASTDTVTGCFADFTVGSFVTFKIAPLIQLFPYDGLICPNSTITLSVTQPGTYNWIGPDGSIVGTGQSLIVSSGGLYSCEFTDPDGCMFFLEQVLITEYITPFLDFSPINVLCGNGDVELIPVYNGVADVHWLAPITATTNTVMVNTPGTYYVEITQCGTTTLDSVTVYQAGFTPTLTASDLSVCIDGTVTLTANAGMLSYEWNDDLFAGNTFTVTEPGDYSVHMINQLGCEEDISITIGSHPASQTPSFADMTACQGDDIVLTDNSGLATGWYSDSTNAQAGFSGSTWTLPNIPGDTTIFVAYDQQPCPFAFDMFTITVTDTVVPGSINGDNTLCEGQELQLDVPFDPTYSYLWTYNSDTLSTTNNTDVSDNVFLQSGIVSLTVTNSCSVENLQLAVTVIPELQLALNAYNLHACEDEPAALYAVPDFSGTLYWTNGQDSLQGNPLVVTPEMWQDSIFYVYGIDNNGCISLPTSAILNFFDCNPVLPNVITSNNDGTNDFFFIPNLDLMPDNYLVIVNRWGNMIFEMENYDNSFRGEDLNEGVYFYLFYRKGKDSGLEPAQGFFHLYH